MWADYDSGLPIRSESDGLDERLHVKIVDGSSGAVNQAEVDSDSNLHIEVHGNQPGGTTDEILTLSELGYANTDGIYHVSNNTDPGNIGLVGHSRAASPADANQVIRWTGTNGSSDNTVWAMDVSVADGNGNPVTTSNPLPVSISGPVNVDGVYNVSTNADPDNIGLIAHVRNATPGDTHQTIRLTGVNGTTSTTVWALDVALRDENAEPYSSANPLPVSFSLTGGGDTITDYKKASAIASDATDEHAYQVTAATTLTLSKIMAAGSGKIKLEVAAGSSGTETEFLVLFNSTAFPNVQYEFAETIEIAAGDWLLLTVTNLDNQSQDVYSLIEGEEN